MLIRATKMQLKIMLRGKEFKCAVFATLMYSCLAFVFILMDFQGVDISQIKDANQSVCFSQLNRLWFFFSLIYPFLVVLPFSTSFIDDCSYHVLPVCFSRTSKVDYFLAKLLACFIGTTFVIFVPFLFNLVICNVFLPHNCNTWFGEYAMGNYYRQLLGTNILYNTVHCEMPLLKVYLWSPLFYNIIYLVLFSAFSGLLGAWVLSISFSFSLKKITLFIPLFVILQLLNVYDAYRFSVSLETGLPYINFNVLNYVVPTVSKGHSCVFFGIFIIIVVLSIISSTYYGIHNDVKNLQ